MKEVVVLTLTMLPMTFGFVVGLKIADSAWLAQLKDMTGKTHQILLQEKQECEATLPRNQICKGNIVWTVEDTVNSVVK